MPSPGIPKINSQIGLPGRISDIASQNEIAQDQLMHKMVVFRKYHADKTERM
jgi:hypothetical protein